MFAGCGGQLIRVSVRQKMVGVVSMNQICESSRMERMNRYMRESRNVNSDWAIIGKLVSGKTKLSTLLRSVIHE